MTRDGLRLIPAYALLCALTMLPQIVRELWARLTGRLA